MARAPLLEQACEPKPRRTPLYAAALLAAMALAALAALILLAVAPSVSTVLARGQPKLPSQSLISFSDVDLDNEGWPIVQRPAARARACWGIVTAGRVAHDFTAAVVGMGGCVHAVAAGHLPHAAERAAAFASAFRLPASYDSYEALANDPKVTMVYGPSEPYP